MDKKVIDLLYIFSALIGVHLSLPGYPMIRLSFIVLALTILKYLLKKKFYFNCRGLFICLIIMILGIIPYFTNDKFIVKDYISYTFYILQGLFIVFLIKDKISIVSIYKLIFLFWSINVVLGGYQIITGIHLPMARIERYTSSISNVPLGTFFNQNDFAVFLVLVIPFFIFHLSNVDKVRHKIGMYTGLIINIFMIISTGSTGAIISAIISLMISYILICMQRKNMKPIVAMLIFTLLIGVFIKTLDFNYIELEYIKAKIDRVSTEGIMSRDRKVLFNNYLEISKENIMGVGGGQAQNLNYILFNDRNNPHSLFLEILINYGMVGLIFSSVFFIMLLIKSLKNYVLFWKAGDLFNRNLSAVLLVNLMSFIIISNVPSRILNGFDIIWVILGLIYLNNDGARLKHRNMTHTLI